MLTSTAAHAQAVPRLPFARLTAPSVDLSHHWDRAYHLWLDSHPSPNTRRAYQRAYEQFQAFADRPPWKVTKTHIAAWHDHLRRQGLAHSTIHQCLAALSSFYTYASHIYTLTGPDGQEQPLHHYNPVQAIRRPRVSPYGKAAYLSVDQARALLRAIPRHTLQGLRDYALFLAYLATGRRSAEIRRLRWGDFKVESTLSGTWSIAKQNSQTNVENPGICSVSYSWRGKGKTRRDQCPPPIWEAIQHYLHAADRLETIQPHEYIFTALNNNAAHLPNVNPSPRNCSPISGTMSLRLLKKYARHAGIDPHGLTIHTLRHTAAMLRKQAGDDLQSISNFLGHTSLATTQIYLHHIEGRQDATWLKVEALLGLAPSPKDNRRPSPGRRRTGGEVVY